MSIAKVAKRDLKADWGKCLDVGVGGCLIQGVMICALKAALHGGFRYVFGEDKYWDPRQRYCVGRLRQDPPVGS